MTILADLVWFLIGVVVGVLSVIFFAVLVAGTGRKVK